MISTQIQQVNSYLQFKALVLVLAVVDYRAKERRKALEAEVKAISYN